MTEPQERLGLRCDYTERQRWQLAADASAADSLAQWVRDALNRAAKRDLAAAKRRKRQREAERGASNPFQRAVRQRRAER